LLKVGAKDLPTAAPTAKTTPQASALIGSKTAAEAVQRALVPLTKTCEESATHRLHARHPALA